VSVEFDIADGVRNIPPQIVWKNDRTSGTFIPPSLYLCRLAALMSIHSRFLQYTTARPSATIIQWIYPNRAGDQVAVNVPHLQRTQPVALADTPRRH
jgi:hypothetical protein